MFGSWSLNFDWYCDGTYGNTTLQLNPNNTFSTNDGGNGAWSMSGNQCTIAYSNGTTYWGTVNASFTYMNGTMTDYDGDTGCWNANRISYATPPPAIQSNSGTETGSSSGIGTKK